MKTQWVACLALALGACPSATVDPNDGTLGPTVEFDPAHKIVPFPNNLLLDPTTGKVSLPEQCNEGPATALTRTGTLNKLDGFGTYETAISVTFTEPVDPSTLDGNVLLFERVKGGDSLDPLTAIPIPLAFIPGKTVRFNDQTDITTCSDPVMVDQVTIIPRVPLDQKSTYTVAVLNGVKTATGDAFNPSFTWSLVREPQQVVRFDDAGNVALNLTPLDPLRAADLAQLQGIDLLWNAHHQAIVFLGATGHDSSELALAFEFNTQTTTDPLDPTVAGSPAAAVDAVTNGQLVGVSSLTAGINRTTPPFVLCDAGGGGPGTDNNTQCFLKINIGLAAGASGAAIYPTGNAFCGQLGCAAVGDVLVAGVSSDQYQTATPNPYTDPVAPSTIPAAWDDPNKPTKVKSELIQVLVFVPVTAAPATGFPTVIFQHGIGQSKTNLFFVGSQLAGQGFASAAIDLVYHDSRAIRISNTADADPKKSCADDPRSLRADHGPSPVSSSHCYAPVLPGDLAAQRDGVRQSVLDQQRLLVGLQACGTTKCAALKVDTANIVYLGHSLGGIIGSITAAVRSDIEVAVLDVPGAGVVDILENTKSQAISCGLVDGLIAAGVLIGDKSVDANSDGIPESGLCMTDAWKTQPGYAQFSVIYRWVIDPADPANYASLLETRKFLIQRVDNDQVVPNIATDNLGALVEQLRGDASCGIPINGRVVPSTALLAAPTANHFLDYLTVPAGTPGCAPGNTFAHGSLLVPEAGAAGSLGTARIQTDAIFFFLSNIE